MYVYSMSDGDILHVDIHDTRGGLRIDDCLPFCIIASCFGVRRTWVASRQSLGIKMPHEQEPSKKSKTGQIRAKPISMGWWIRWIRWIRWIYGCLVQALLWSWGHQAAEATRQSVNALVELRRKVMQKVSWCEFATFARLKQMRLENQAYLQRTQANSGFKLLSTKLLRSHFHSFSIEISFPSRCIRERHFFSFSVIAFFRL